LDAPVTTAGTNYPFFEFVDSQEMLLKRGDKRLMLPSIDLDCRDQFEFLEQCAMGCSTESPDVKIRVENTSTVFTLHKARWQMLLVGSCNDDIPFCDTLNLPQSPLINCCRQMFEHLCADHDIKGMFREWKPVKTSE
jgi:hypothetical protein